MRLSEKIGNTNVTELGDEELVQVTGEWKDKAAELEDLLLRARDELQKFHNVLVHPSARDIIARRDAAFQDIQTRLALQTRKTQLYAQTAEAWKAKYEEVLCRPTQS